jgi:hypothetical protein
MEHRRMAGAQQRALNIPLTTVQQRVNDQEATEHPCLSYGLATSTGYG